MPGKPGASRVALIRGKREQQMHSVADLEKVLRSMLRDFLGDRLPKNAEIDRLADLDLESVQIMEFMVEVEDRFDIAIDVESFANAKSIRDLAEVVAQRSS